MTCPRLTMPEAERRRPPLPPAGIYELAGTLHGLPCFIAFDHEGEFTLRAIERGTSGQEEKRQLVAWLNERGVTLLPSRADLSLVV